MLILENNQLRAGKSNSTYCHTIPPLILFKDIIFKYLKNSPDFQATLTLLHGMNEERGSICRLLITEIRLATILVLIKDTVRYR